MSKATIFHNPRCSKSRAALELLTDAVGEENVEVVEYLKHPPTKRELKKLGSQLGLAPKEFVRRGEAEFDDLKLGQQLDDAGALYAAIAAHPRLLERPIVVVGGRAIVGRPPEKVLTLLD